MVTESYQKAKTPQIKFAGFIIIILPHRHIPDSAELHSVPASHFNKASEINLFDYFKRNKASFLFKNNETKAINTIV